MSSAFSIVPDWALAALGGITFVILVIICIRWCSPCRCCCDEEEVFTEGGCCICCVSSNNYSNDTGSDGDQEMPLSIQIFPDEPFTASISSDTSDTVRQTSRPITRSIKGNEMLVDCKWILGHSRKCRNDSCPICMEEYSNGDDLVLCPCRHAYHRVCLENWLRVKNFCPLCKKPVCKKSEKTPLL